jgi:hypothetical protein
MKIYEISKTDLYSLEPIEEGASQIFGRTGRSQSKGKARITTQRFRCPTGPRKGRIVANPSTCNKPLNIKQSTKMKNTRQAKGSIHGARSSYTKKYSQASQRVKRANMALKARRGKR